MSAGPKTLTPEQWRRAVAGGKPCAVCGTRLDVQAHHVVYQQVLRNIAQSAACSPEPWLWDKRNGLPVCKHCHGSHHGGSRPISRALLVKLVPTVFVFAREVGPIAVAHLRRRYPLPDQDQPKEQV